MGVVMTISKPIWNERDTIPWNLRSLVPLQTWAWELQELRMIIVKHEHTVEQLMKQLGVD